MSRGVRALTVSLSLSLLALMFVAACKDPPPTIAWIQQGRLADGASAPPCAEGCGEPVGLNRVAITACQEIPSDLDAGPDVRSFAFYCEGFQE